jgi:hypothetical protein
MEITGVAMTPNKDILRFDEATKEYYYAYFTDQDVEDFAEQFMKVATLKANFEHDPNSFTSDLMVKESWIVRNPEMDATKELGFTDITKGDWVLTYKTRNPELWAKIKESTLTGFSVELDNFKKHNMSLVMKTDTGMVINSTADALAVGIDVTTTDANGQETPCADGDYTIDNGSVVTVAGGKVTAVTEPMSEAAQLSKMFGDAMEAALKPLREELEALKLKIDNIPAAPAKSETKPETKKELSDTDIGVIKLNKVRKAIDELTKKQ